MRAPSIGSRRCMIYLPKQRILDDACISCNRSATYCDAVAPERCCIVCQHLAHSTD